MINTNNEVKEEALEVAEDFKEEGLIGEEEECLLKEVFLEERSKDLILQMKMKGLLKWEAGEFMTEDPEKDLMANMT